MTCRLAVLAVAASTVALGVPEGASGAEELKFGTAPALPALPTVTLNAEAQTANATMKNFSVTDTRTTKLGWNVTVEGLSGTGKSPVFAQYCTKKKCGTDTEGYVAGGQELAANSLTLDSTGAKLTGGSGKAPTLQCSSPCNVDSASSVKIASAASGGAGEKTWTASGFSTTSLALAVPTTLMALPTKEVYRVDILWTLASGP